MTQDTPKTTVGGATFIAPAEWRFSVRGPGFTGVELVVGKGPKPTLVLRDPQHEYVFEAK